MKKLYFFIAIAWRFQEFVFSQTLPIPPTMKKYVVRLLQITAILSIASGTFAQEFFRDLGPSRSSGGFGPVFPSEYSYEDTSPYGLAPLRPGLDLNVAQAAEEADRYNFAIGPVQFGLAAGIGFEFNDNITLAENDTLSDVIFRPFLDIQGIWRLSELNTLRLSVGVSYAKYFNNPQFDSNVLLTPNTELALTFFVGELKFTVRDRISYQEDNFNIALGETNGAELYRRWQNQAGIQLDWAINDKVTLAGGYDYYSLWSLGDLYSQQDQTTQTFFLKPSFKISPAITVGINASYSIIDFTDYDRPNGQGLLAGPFIQWQVSDYTNLYLEGGYQNLNFDQLNADSVNAILYNNQDISTYYVKFEINNKPSDIFEHNLSFSKTAETGFQTNYFDLYHVEYGANWKIFPHTEISPLVFYEYYAASGVNGEEASRVGAGLGMRYHFSNSITLGLDYRFLAKDSNLPDFSYRQNLFFVSLYYKF